jgi:hypothetical protein
MASVVALADTPGGTQKARGVSSDDRRRARASGAATQPHDAGEFRWGYRLHGKS